MQDTTTDQDFEAWLQDEWAKLPEPAKAELMAKITSTVKLAESHFITPEVEATMRATLAAGNRLVFEAPLNTWDKNVRPTLKAMRAERRRRGTAAAWRLIRLHRRQSPGMRARAPRAKAIRFHGSRRAGASSSTSSADPGDDDPPSSTSEAGARRERHRCLSLDCAEKTPGKAAYCSEKCRKQDERRRQSWHAWATEAAEFDAEAERRRASCPDLGYDPALEREMVTDGDGQSLGYSPPTVAPGWADVLTIRDAPVLACRKRLAVAA